jgi:NADH-quinone oxidoreductase subunit M
MILPVIIAILIFGAILALISKKINDQLPYYIAIVCQIISLIVIFFLLPDIAKVKFSSSAVYDYNIPWISVIGTNFHLSVDGFSFIFIVLTLFLGILGTLLSKNIKEDTGFFHFNMLLLLAGIMGIFMAADLLLFFFFWELMLVPMYFLLAKYLYNPEKNEHVPFKFLLYTQLSGLFMLVSILALFFIHGHQTNIYSFEINDLMQTNLSLSISALLMLGFLLAFLVKLPIIPFHGWMPATFISAPLGIILTGILIKTGAYGIFRFIIPLFPEASVLFAPTAMALGIFTVLYAGFIAFSSNDIRKIAAYSSISHTGYILVGIYAFNMLAWQGVVFQMIASALAIGGLAIFSEMLYSRTQTYDITKLGGLLGKTPVLSGFGMFISIAILGLPGLANFIAEFLILAGTFQKSVIVAVLVSLGIVLAAAYSLRIIQKLFVGEYSGPAVIKDFSIKEKIIMSLLTIILVLFGFYTRPITQTTENALQNLMFLDSHNNIPNPDNKNNAASVKLYFNNKIE